jgi:hypothetical protein
MRANPRRYALGLAVAAAIAALAIASLALRAEPPVATGSPSALPTAIAPRVLFTHSVLLDTVPGGGPVTTSAYDSFVVVTPGGTRQSHAVAGLAVGTPVFDGRDRVAYWRRPSLTRSPLTLSGAYEVAVWEIKADRERVLLTLSDERSSGELLWSADRKSLVVPTRTAPGAAGAAQNRLLLIDAETGATRTLHTSAGDASIGPIFADPQVLVGVRGNSYVVLDAISSAVRTQTPARVPASFMGEFADFASSPDGTVLELLRRFESDSGPLRIWNVRDPRTDIAKVDQRGISDPIFWPGRTEIVFTRSAELAAVDYDSGRTRTLVSPPGATFVVAVDSGGQFALVRTDKGLQILERTDDELKARPDLPVTADPLLNPLGIYLP